MTVKMDPASIGARLAEVAALTDLDPARRLDAKIDYSPQGIARRLQQVADLRRLCLKLGSAVPAKSE